VLQLAGTNARLEQFYDADSDDGKRFLVSADEKLTAFVELESAIAGQGDGF
jgi:hypothetical protein